MYLTPIFPAQSKHRYNASSFAHVDPLLGGDEALVRLSREVHTRGLRIIGDLTTNHSGDDHPWFTAALSSPEAPERRFYYVADDGSYEQDKVFAALNLSAEGQTVTFSESLGHGSYIDHLSNEPIKVDDDAALTLDPWSACIFVQSPGRFALPTGSRVILASVGG